MALREDSPAVAILGCRGIPASHGGFEAFAQELALYLVLHGWVVTVYCQGSELGQAVEEDWRGVRLVHIPTRLSGAMASIEFDCLCTVHALRTDMPLFLTLGYNTAFLGVFYRLADRRTLFNMDGIEWRRGKWSAPVKLWFLANEWLGCYLAHHLIADHPEIARHLATRVDAAKISMIPYGAHPVPSANSQAVRALGLEPGRYALLVARPEPENSLLEIVQAFCSAPTGIRLAVVGMGSDDTHSSRYERAVRRAAGSEVTWLGPLYDRAVVEALRFHALFYVHGHRVGGTNPSLVEALAAGCPVLARDNGFNRWVAGPDALYFDSVESCRREMLRLIAAPAQLAPMRSASRERHQRDFEWPPVLSAYEKLLRQHWAAARGASRSSDGVAKGL